jgi:carbon storage regulator
MLILSRKTGESIIIDGRILVKIVRIEGGMVKVGIDAPAEVPVHRQEVFDEIQRNNQEAATRSRPALPVVKLNPMSSSQAPTASEASPAEVGPPPLPHVIP